MASDANNFQRQGAPSNAQVGSVFEEKARTYFQMQGIELRRKFEAPVGVGDSKKIHRFDLGSETPPVLVECKSHTWTQGGNMPSAKMTVWNEAMYYFFLAPRHFRKIMFVMKHHRRDESLAAYYLRIHGHLVPDDIEFWEYDIERDVAERLR
jgi:hypothetical protein